MKLRVFFLVFILALFCLPGVALAGFDEYGFNHNANMFIGTLDNWTAYLHGEPALPVPPPNTTDVIFMARKWNNALDDGFFGGQPYDDTAWLATYGYMHLSGEQTGWLWQGYFIYRYKSNPGPEDVPVPGEPGMYFIVCREWLTDPDGNETVLVNVQTDLHFFNRHKLNSVIMLIKSLAHRHNFYK